MQVTEMASLIRLEREAREAAVAAREQPLRRRLPREHVLLARRHGLRRRAHRLAQQRHQLVVVLVMKRED